jgi:hypothetical protein
MLGAGGWRQYSAYILEATGERAGDGAGQGGGSGDLQHSETPIPNGQHAFI